MDNLTRIIRGLRTPSPCGVLTSVRLPAADILATIPDLLAALKNAVDTIGYVHSEDWETVKLARAAIARTEKAA